MKYEVPAAMDLAPGQKVVVSVGGRSIGIFNVDGELYALPNLCPHQRGPLCEGRITGTLVATERTHWTPEWIHEGEIACCPWHGMEFHIPTGRCLAEPKWSVRTFRVGRENGKVVVEV